MNFVVAGVLLFCSPLLTLIVVVMVGVVVVVVVTFVVVFVAGCSVLISFVVCVLSLDRSNLW